LVPQTKSFLSQVRTTKMILTKTTRIWMKRRILDWTSSQ
jgi:hypothetical protein